jgi:hypothetical protein
MPIRHGGVGKTRFKLAARPLLAQNNRAAFIETYGVERVLPNVDAHRGNGRAGLAGHRGAPLVAPSQHRLLVGWEHGRTIPLVEVGEFRLPHSALTD